MENKVKKSGYDALYLSVCALKGVKPDYERIREMDIENLYYFCRFHSLVSIVCTALEYAEINIPSVWREEKNKAIRKNFLLDTERGRICKFFEHNDIRYMPLKGALLQEMYPMYGMRQMADNDILYDERYREKVNSFMLDSGYTAECVGRDNHDLFIKPPVYNIELHITLFDKDSEERLYNYYENIFKKLVRRKDDSCEYRFSDEDFYLYMLCHTYKHYSHGGTGLRSLLDCLVYLSEKGDRMNDDYILDEAEKLGIAEFSDTFGNLSRKIFNNPHFPELSQKESEMLEYIMLSGTYGTHENAVVARMKPYKGKMGKMRYIFKRLFPDVSAYEKGYPFFYRNKWLLPVGWVYRISKGIATKRKRLLREFFIMIKK